MIKASGRLDLPFTCAVNGVPTAPTGTPTGTLVKNGTDLGTSVTVTMSTAQGVASCTIPSDAANGDRFYLRISAVVSGVTYALAGPVETVQNTVSLPAEAPADWLTSTGLATSAVNEIRDAIWAATSRTLTDFGFTVDTTDAAATASALASIASDVMWAKRAAAVLIGTCSTAGTSVEVYTMDDVTVTATVDEDGNRSSVVFS